MAFGTNKNSENVEKSMRCLTLIETDKGTWLACPDRVYARGSKGKIYKASEICGRLGLFVSEEGRKTLIKKTDVCYNTYISGKTEYTFTLNGKATKREAFYPAVFDKQEGLMIAPNTLRTLCNFFEFSGGRVRNSAYAKFGYGTIYVFSQYHVVRNCPSIGSVYIESGERLEERIKKDNTFKNWIEYTDTSDKPFEYFPGAGEDEPDELLRELPKEEPVNEPEPVAESEVEEIPEETVPEEVPAPAPAEPEAPPVPEEPVVEERIQPEYFTFFTGRRIRKVHEFRNPDKTIYWPDDKDMGYVEKEGMNGLITEGLGVLLINSTIYFTMKDNYREPCIKFCVIDNEYHIELHAGLNYTFTERRTGKKDRSEVKQSMLKLMLYKISSKPDTIYDMIFEAEKDKNLLKEAEKAGDCMLRCERRDKYNEYILTALPEVPAETGAAAEENKNEAL